MKRNCSKIKRHLEWQRCINVPYIRQVDFKQYNFFVIHTDNLSGGGAARTVEETKLKKGKH